MFLGPDQQPSGEDLIAGLMISSGNDAAIELALRVSGSVDAFVEEMNERSRMIGYDEFRFFDPAGLDDANRVTAIDFARFAADLLRLYPETLGYSRRQAFTWPPDQAGGITQENRNGLVTTYPGADGLKTGYIEESGYNIVVSAEREGLRLIAVVLGVDGSNHAEGGQRREDDATAILDWGFDTWTAVAPSYPPIDSPEVFGGTADLLELYVDVSDRLLLLRRDVPLLRGELTVPDVLWAPIEIGAEIGVVRYRLEDCTVAEYPIRAATSVEPARLPRRIWDRIRWWWRTLIRRVSSVRANWYGDSRLAVHESRRAYRAVAIPSIPEDSGCESRLWQPTSGYPRGREAG